MEGKRLIYVIDDDEWYVELMAMRLQENPVYKVKTFTTGEAMLENLTTIPDLIVLDYNLNSSNPNAKNGHEIMQDLLDKKHHIPIILLSGIDDVSTAVNLLKFHASDYIVKGDDALDNLEKSIEKVFAFKELNQNKHVLLNQKNQLQKRIALASVLCFLVILLIFLI